MIFNRITPAYAGKRLFTLDLDRCSEDHPRLCGEKPSSTDCQKGLLGSPPPMRGKVFRVRNMSFTIGITPAYAGKRQWCRPRTEFS